MNDKENVEILNVSDNDINIIKNFKCKQCGKCCYLDPIDLTMEDIKKISKFLNIDTKKFCKKYTKKYFGKKNIYKFKITKPCIFYNKQAKLCKINNSKPEICKIFPIKFVGNIPIIFDAKNICEGLNGLKCRGE